MLATKNRWFLASGALLIAALLLWASGGPGWVPPGAPAPSAAAALPAPKPPATKKPARPLPEVNTLYEQASSAYHAQLFADGDGVVLVTQTGFTTFITGEAPAQHAVALGPVAARQGGALVFWRSGALRAVSLSGGDERELAALPAPPRYLLTCEGQLVWIQVVGKGRTSLQTLSGGDVRVIYESEGSASAAVSSASAVYWVSVRADGSWNIGRIGLDGQHTSTRSRRGRPPAMLALGQDGVYFYAGPEHGVRRLTFDLEKEASVLAKVVCSPLVVSSGVVCAHVGGLFEIPLSGSAPRFLAAERAGPVTAVAATNERAFWVAESGGERLVVRSVALPER
jgi:hypothetical protein